ncbi:olfactory receptor 8U9-like [Pleurodeles waltl]|uniref:olfactory receptor 8U9-like n=1 Tax=Pleurodeles waltl TaxID=8319 RepID=UPI00370999C1
MKKENTTSATEFVIVGFSELPQLKVPVFWGFLFIYLIILSGNVLIMVIVYFDSHLHTPMYFFLVNLSLVDIIYTSTIFPKMLATFFVEVPRVSFDACLMQLYIFIAMVCTETILLTAMAYDHYVAICNPLRYRSTINRTLCLQLAAGSWMFSLVEPIPHTVLTSALSFCASRQVNHIFCDITALIKLSCSSTHAIEMLTFICGAVVGLSSFALILTSYFNIISSILKINSGRDKAFSTCGSHLTAVMLFYGSLMVMYLRPPSTYSMTQNKMLSLLYIGVVPLCNPIVYSLKNQELKNALRKVKRMKRK